MSEDVTVLIDRDHRAIRRLCEELRATPTGDAEVLRELGEVVRAHFRAVERQVHPLAARELPGEAEIAARIRDTDSRAEALLAALEVDGFARQGAGDTGYADDGPAERVFAALAAHIRVEEDVLLPALRAGTAAQRLEALAELYRQERWGGR